MDSGSIINRKNIIGLIQRTLNEVDERLVEHGSRVAYLVSRMIETEGGYSKEVKQKICMLAVLHDIGAYKTEEIDRMVEFETDNVWEHPAYGYVFLRSFSPLGEWARAVLFHHTAAEKLPILPEEIKMAAQMICLCDRMEIFSRCYAEGHVIEAHREKVFTYLESKRGSQFLDEVVDCFIKTEKEESLFGALSRSKISLEDIFQEVVLTEEECLQYLNMLIYVIDFRSQHTVTHTITTTSISCCTARYMGIKEERIERIRYGAMMHDLGKIGIPVEILEYPGKLSTQAMGVMRTHVEITERILGGMVAEDVTNIALRHHEKMDGSGYPKGLLEQDMALEEQIVAVSDIVSALLGTRSYKEAYSKDRTTKIIKGLAAECKLNQEVVAVVDRYFDDIVDEVAESCAPALENYYGMQAEYRYLLEKYRQ